MKEEYSKCLEQNLSVMQTISGLTSLSARINDMCGRTRLSEYSAIQAVLKGSAIWDVAKPKCSAGARPQSKVLIKNREIFGKYLFFRKHSLKYTL